MTRSTPRGQAIGAQTRVLAQRLARSRVSYWQALLARPQLAGPIVSAVRDDVETEGWDRRLSCLIGFGAASIATRRKADRERYRRACERAAQWLAGLDRDCGAANAVHLGIALWSARALPDDHRWRGHRIYPARTRSKAWRRYWTRATDARRLRERLRNEIITLNEGLVIHQVNKWAAWAAEGHLSREDLQQAAREGLFRAADLYEADRQPPRAFSTYAAWWIRHHVFRLHQQQRSDVRAPIGVQALALDLSAILEEHDTRDPERLQVLLVASWRRRGKGATKRPPTTDAISQALEYMGGRQVSMDSPVGHEGTGERRTLADMLPDPSPGADELIDRERVLARMLGALQSLDHRDRGLLEERFGFDGDERTAAELARHHGTNRRAVEDQEHRALADLRSRMQGIDHPAV